MKFKIVAIQASKSRQGGSNIRCQEITVSQLFGECAGREFIIQSSIIPDAALVGSIQEGNIRLESVKYGFERDGKHTDVEYTRGFPY